MTRVIITVGPQGAGKTTFCQSLMAKADTERVALFSRDSFLEDLYGRHVWNPYLCLFVPGMRHFWKAVAEKITNKSVVLIDSFFPQIQQLEEMQRRLGMKQDESSPVHLEALWFKTPNTVAAEQHVRRTRHPEDPMYNFWYKVALDQTEQFWASATSLRDLIPTIWEIDPRQGILGPPPLRLALPMQ